MQGLPQFFVPSSSRSVGYLQEAGDETVTYVRATKV
ncbi:unnamed protein product [Ectocarpus sp. CCAP 1310/34]|nr:unnamed protein product [Ectocarpus sp. CCAP 1310/34]